MRLMFTLFVLLFTQLFLNLAHASPSNRVSAEQGEKHSSQAKPDERRKRKIVARTSKKTKVVPAKEQAKLKVTAKTKDHSKSKEAVHAKTKVDHKHPVSTKLVRHKAEKPAKEIKSITREVASTSSVVCAKEGKKAYGRHRKHKAVAEKCAPVTLSAAHKKKYINAKQTAMTKLMHQVGKPYRWGGTSPHTGFDCSGLVYYAYKDLMRIKMPRTANEMYHLRDAAPVKRGELESGDLVFFRITKRGAADHVGVYLGNGKFIQSPRSGEDIKISYLADDYWQGHYVGARRVMTPKTIR
ncbi:hydrolase [Rahnella sp. SAP-1]|jgi:murein DD-endopeptidase|uniref:Hydrolase n=1 Tax=Rouxiella aceris TaxID=2703884 RepID=A0A848MP06_9GAMM|nr:C40 family peptidase [Rouxiella aceris]NMP28799.1 hydrolase [Rouxiella aceris]